MAPWSRRFVVAAFACLLATGGHDVTAVELPPTSLGAPVRIPEPVKTASQIQIGDENILELKAGAGSMTADERAAYVSGKLMAIAESDKPLLKVRVVRDGADRRIATGEQVLMVISPADALAAGIDIETLAAETATRIEQALAAYRESRTPRSILIGVGLTVASLLALALAILLIKRGVSRLDQALMARLGRMGAEVRIKDVQVLSGEQIEGMVRGALAGIRILLILLCLYFFLPLALSFFAVTRTLGRHLFELFLAPLETLAASFVAYIPNFFFIGVICGVAYYTLRAVRYAFGLIDTGKLVLDWFYQEWAIPTYQIVRTLIIVMAIISAFPYIPGSGSAAFQGVGLVLGLVVSFASSSAISNIIAGVILVYTRAFRFGDWIRVGDTVGAVVEKTLLVTRLRDAKNVVITIPNSLVLNSHILNYSGGDQALIVHSSVTIGYDVPWPKIHDLLIAAARKTDLLESEPPPFVLQTALNDFYVAYEINAYTKFPHSCPKILSELHGHILDAFDAAGVEIMSPHYTAQRDGNASTVPSVVAAPEYVAPRFRVGTVQTDA